SSRSRDSENRIMIHVTAITPSVHHGIAKSNSTGDEKARYSKYDPSIPRGTPMTRDLTEHSMLSRVNIRFSPAGVMPTLRKAANSRARKSTLVDMVLITFVSPISVSMVTHPDLRIVFSLMLLKPAASPSKTKHRLWCFPKQQQYPSLPMFS